MFNCNRYDDKKIYTVNDSLLYHRMIKLTDKQIDEIAQNLDCGFNCHISKDGEEFIFIPEEMEMYDFEDNPWIDLIEKVEQNPDNYFDIEILRSYQSFEIMEDFMRSLSDSLELKNRLYKALKNRKPFRGFMHIIDNSGEYREAWFKFKNQKLKEYVLESVENFNTMK